MRGEQRTMARIRREKSGAGRHRHSTGRVVLVVVLAEFAMHMRARICTLEIGHGRLHELRIANGDVRRANGLKETLKRQIHVQYSISRPRGRKAVATLL